MKIFITVGTTSFDPLIQFVDSNIVNHQVIIQKANGSYKPRNHSSFEFKSSINEEINQADVVICHAGAGTIYNLLENRKKIIVIPNLDRIDRHQIEIANFIEKNNFGFVCRAFDELTGLLLKIEEAKFTPYTKEEFFLSDFILSQIES